MGKYFITGGLAGPWKKERYNQADSSFVISADGALGNDGTVTVTNIDKTPAEVAAAVAAKKTVCLWLKVPFEIQEETVTLDVCLPFAQRIVDNYEFTVITDVDEGHGASLVYVVLAATGNEWTEAAGKSYMLSLASA